ncbi:MAG TPA: DUF2795 domain-containing protein [Solirubrobacteraceae bacterium]|nr:DUF2795 domain-containing protein [Solirubrobacteraceae bacterium]
MTYAYTRVKSFGRFSSAGLWVPALYVAHTYARQRTSTTQEAGMPETPLDVTAKYPEGIEWPANKDEVVAAAERNGAPVDVIGKLRTMEDEHYPGPNAVHNALWMKA